MQQRFRLRHSQDFARLRQYGRSYQNRSVVMSLMPNGLAYNRYGFITSKQLGNAVTRNRVRRLLREAVRLLHPNLQIGFDVVVIGRHSLVGQPFGAVLRIIETLFSQAGIVMESGGE